MGRRILIIYTGGTIGMQPSPEGYVPQAGFAEQLAALTGPDRWPEMPDHDLFESRPALDSANMRPRDWYRIAGDIAARYDAYDGFVVLHGTDTMAYTASALSFALRGLRKPVIVTGSQIPLREMLNDARNNLTAALLLAANHPVAEVGLYFNGRLLRANRSTKVRAGALDAFDSPNYPALAEVGIATQLNRNALLQPTGPEAFEFPGQHDAAVPVLKIFPGISHNHMNCLLSHPCDGVVLECFGLGNAPTGDDAFTGALREATDRGVVVVAVSQCPQSQVDLEKYAAGSALTRAGVLSGYDMTTEAALAKLQHCLSLRLSGDQVRERMGTSLCGEFTPMG